MIYGELILDRLTRQAELAGKAISLSARAFAVLEYLMLHPNEIITRQQLQEELWGWSYEGGTRAVDVRISEIRHALVDKPGSPRYIETVIGHGYRFLGEVTGRA